MIPPSIETLVSSSYQIYQMRSCSKSQTSNSSNSQHQLWVLCSNNSQCKCMGPQGAHAMLITNCAQVGREAGLLQAITLLPYTGTRCHNISDLLNSFQALHRLIWLYHLSCHLCGICHTSHHTGVIHNW